MNKKKKLFSFVQIFISVCKGDSEEGKSKFLNFV